MQAYLKTFVVVFCLSLYSMPCFAVCPSMDFTGDCFVDFEDFAVFAEQWLTGDGVPADVVSIPAGWFEMGDAFSENLAIELPVHAVHVDAFMMGRYEVTNSQYCAYLNDAKSHGQIEVRADHLVYAVGGSNIFCATTEADATSQISFRGGTTKFLIMAGKANHPMVQVTWWGAIAYANWRSQQEGWQDCYNLSTGALDLRKQGFRLPTEAEWEYAARGGLEVKRYPWGDSLADNQANYSASGDPYATGDFPWTTPVGFYNGALHLKTDFNWPDPVTSYHTTNGVNGYGLYDMAGNVWEWCNDWYLGTYYSISPYDNPIGPTSGDSRILRGGGSWWNQASICTVSYRNFGWFSPPARNKDVGFRLVLDFN